MRVPRMLSANFRLVAEVRKKESASASKIMVKGRKMNSFSRGEFSASPAELSAASVTSVTNSLH